MKKITDKMRLDCRWYMEEAGCDWWNTSCGHAFILNDGTPKQNNMKFCCYCGNLIYEYTICK